MNGPDPNDKSTVNVSGVDDGVGNADESVCTVDSVTTVSGLGDDPPGVGTDVTADVDVAGRLVGDEEQAAATSDAVSTIDGHLRR